MKTFIPVLAIVLLFCQISCKEKKIDKILVAPPIINIVKTVKIDSIKKNDTLDCSNSDEISVCNSLTSAQFKGGDMAFKKFIAKNLIYPASSLTGVIIVRFTVDKDGSMMKNCVKISKSTLPNEFNEEAIRLVQLSPNWIPAIQDGKPFRQMRRVPINFVKNK